MYREREREIEIEREKFWLQSTKAPSHGGKRVAQLTTLELERLLYRKRFEICSQSFKDKLPYF